MVVSGYDNVGHLKDHTWINVYIEVFNPLLHTFSVSKFRMFPCFLVFEVEQ